VKVLARLCKSRFYKRWGSNIFWLDGAESSTADKPIKSRLKISNQNQKQISLKVRLCPRYGIPTRGKSQERRSFWIELFYVTVYRFLYFWFGHNLIQYEFNINWIESFLTTSWFFHRNQCFLICTNLYQSKLEPLDGAYFIVHTI